jgi:hypothetical protein
MYPSRNAGSAHPWSQAVALYNRKICTFIADRAWHRLKFLKARLRVHSGVEDPQGHEVRRGITEEERRMMVGHRRSPDARQLGHSERQANWPAEDAGELVSA